MKQHKGIWLPDHEKHLPQWMDKHGEMVDGKATYQIKKLRAAVAECKQHRVAVDIGGHCGLWSMHLVGMFRHVVAFEPIAEHRECFAKNVHGKNYNLYDVALGEHFGTCVMHTTDGSSGDSWIKQTSPAGSTRVRTLDAYNLTEVDFIKLDCEGYELPALKGAHATIDYLRPVICVEQKPGHAQRFGYGETEAVQYLQDVHGYKQAREMGGDYIMVPA